MSSEATAVQVRRSHVINSLIGMLLMDKIVENISEKNLVFWDVAVNKRNLKKTFSIQLKSMCPRNILHLHIAVGVGVSPMEGTVYNIEPHVRPGLSNLPAQARQLIPPLLPELRAVLCAGSSEQTVISRGTLIHSHT